MFDINFLNRALGAESVHNDSGLPASDVFASFSTDSRTAEAGDCFIALTGERFDGNDYALECHKRGVRFFILQENKGRLLIDKLTASHIMLVPDTQKALFQLAAAWRKDLFCSVLAITGSSGKTTTRELLVRMLSVKYRVHTARKNWNNEIGLPLTILETPPDTQVLVLELGMNHAGEISRLSALARPDSSVITNIGYAHIGNLGGRDGIAAAKAEIFDGMDSRSVSFINRDDPYHEYLEGRVKGRFVSYGINDLRVLEDRVLNGYRLDYHGETIEIKAPGEHNLENLAAALSIAEYYGISTADRARAAGDFHAVTGRSQVINGSFSIINDCYNANPSSMLAGLRLLSRCKGRRIAVLGDMRELGIFSEELHRMTGKVLSEEKLADTVFLVGTDSLFIQEELINKIDSRYYEDRQKMLHDLAGTVKEGDTVLVKASRSMQLEEAVNMLKGLAGA